MAERGDEAERLREAASDFLACLEGEVLEPGEVIGPDATNILAHCSLETLDAMDRLRALSAPTPPEQRCPTCGSDPDDFDFGHGGICPDPFHDEAKAVAGAEPHNPEPVADPALNQEAERAWTLKLGPNGWKVLSHDAAGEYGEIVEVAERSREAEQVVVEAAETLRRNYGKKALAPLLSNLFAALSNAAEEER